MIQIFDSGYETQAKEHFSGCRIPVAGTLYDRLDWKQSCELAEKAASRGQKIFWDLDMGLFNRLPLPLSDEGQFRALGLALESLLELIKERFLETTLGVCLYRGHGDMRRGFPWEPGELESKTDESQLVTCRDRCWHFLEQLTLNWPDNLPLFTLLDLRRIPSLTQLFLLHQETTGRFCPIIRGLSPVWQLPHLRWEEWSKEGYLSRSELFASDQQAALEQKPVTQGLLTPSLTPALEDHPLWENLLFEIERQEIPTRLLTESLLTSQWDTLDQILVPPGPISPFAERALQGFMAAGGEIVKFEHFLETQPTF